MLGDQSRLAGLMLQEVARGVVKPDRAAVKVNAEQQRQVVELGQQIDRGEVIRRLALRRPQSGDDADGDVRVLGKNAKLAEPRPLVGIEQIEIDANCCGDRLVAAVVVLGLGIVEGGQALGGQPLPGLGDGAGQRQLVLGDAVAQKTVGELQELRPVVQFLREITSSRASGPA